MNCIICGNEKDNKIFQVKEMMLGLRSVFNYFECSSCGCLQLIDIPDDFNEYYPSEDYKPFNRINFLRLFLIKKLMSYILFKNNSIGYLLNKFKKLKGTLDVLANQNITKETRVLEVGCGAGHIISTLKENGIDNVKGIDPNVYGSNLIENKTINQISDEEFDIILFDHSFEHIPDNPYETLKKCFDLLSDEGVLIIAIPLKNKYIWDLYNTNWGSIDAPRHIFLHTMESFKILAENSGFKIEDVYFDSNEFLFISSEQYKCDIPLVSENSYYVNKRKSIFTKKQIKDFKAQAQELNNKKMGDQCVFNLKKRL